jgi:catechol 2,3-dioxygenase-like lactoylglutathione lyase family enzyme
MTDRITANLPAIDMNATAAFYQALGFSVDFKDDGWMILSRGPLELEFFPYPDLDPWSSSFSACVRVADVDALHAALSAANLPLHGIPRLTPPRDEPFGLRMAALIDLNGSLLRLLGPLQHKG